MTGVPVSISGSITVALIVVLGVFVYPWLLRRRGGRVIVAVITLLLAALFIAFESAGERSGTAGAVVAGLLGAAPAVAGVIVTRLQRSPPPANR